KVLKRARAYVSKMPPAIAGEHGHDRTFDVARTLVRRFDLTIAEALPLAREYSNRCQPPWSDKELRHKLEDADKADGERGYLLNGSPSGNSHAAAAAAAPEAPAGDAQPFANFREKKTKINGKPAIIRVGLPVVAVGCELFRLTGGWPKRVGPTLF